MILQRYKDSDMLVCMIHSIQSFVHFIYNTEHTGKGFATNLIGGTFFSEFVLTSSPLSPEVAFNSISSDVDILFSLASSISQSMALAGNVGTEVMM